MAQVRSLKTGIKFIDSPIGKIPVDWRVGTFSEIAEINPKRYLKKGSIHPFVEMAAVKPESHKIQFSTLREYKGGGSKFKNKDTLFARITPCTENGKTAYVDLLSDNELGHGSTEFIVLGPKDNVDPKFIYYCAKWEKVRNIAISKMEGTSGRQRVPNKVFLEDIFLPIPPLSEQKKIAEILSNIDDAIEETDSIIEKTKELKKGLMQKLLTKGIGHKQFKMTEIGEIPETWEVKALNSFGHKARNSITNGPFGSDLLSKEHMDEGVPVIYVRDVKPNRYDRVSSVHVTTEKAEQLRFCNIKYGDVIVAKVGEPPCDAAPYFVNEDSIVTQDVIRIRPDRNVDTYFLSNLINSFRAKREIAKIKIEGTRTRVSLTEFRKIRLPMPSLKEQKEIATILHNVETNIIEEENNKGHLEFLKKSLMQVLLTGKVRVKVS